MEVDPGSTDVNHRAGRARCAKVGVESLDVQVGTARLLQFSRSDIRLKQISTSWDLRFASVDQAGMRHHNIREKRAREEAGKGTVHIK
jgi:hypothetical protein